MGQSKTDAVTRDKLIEDVKTVIADADALLRATAGQAGEKIAEARTRTEAGLKRAQERLKELEVVERGRDAAKSTDQFVNENPWKAVGIAGGLGVIVGLLMGRR